MAEKQIFEWSDVSASNDFIALDGGWPEGMTREQVNDAARVDLASLRTYYDAPEWIHARIQGPDAADIGVFNRITANQFTITITGPDQDVSSYFQDGRIVNVVNGSGAGIDLITQVSGNATYASGVTTVNVKSTVSINVAATDAYAYFTSIARASSLVDDNNFYFIPETADSTGIQASIDLASAVPGGTVLFANSSYSITATILIDGTKGSVRLLGALPETVLLQASGTNLDELLLYDNVNELNKFENLRFDSDVSNNPTGNGYGVRVNAALSPTFDNCQFLNNKHGVHFSGASTKRIIFSGCKFYGFTAHGISTNAATNTHQGTVSGCFFDGLSITAVDPAAVKVAGRWKVYGCQMTNMGKTPVTPRGIWFWNETANNNGGFRCTAVDNEIDMAGGNEGRAIEIGGRRSAAHTNNVTMSHANQIGVHVNSTQAGQIIISVAVQNNTIFGGQSILLNSLTSAGIISDNICVPAAGEDAIQSDGGTLYKFSGNDMLGGARGIHLINTASGCTIDGNNVRSVTLEGIYIDACNDVTVQGNRANDCPIGYRIVGGSIDCAFMNNQCVDPGTRAFSIDSAVDTFLSGNVHQGSGIAILDTATSTSRFGNSFDQDHIGKSETEVFTSSGEADLITLTAQLMPNGGNAGIYMAEVNGFAFRTGGGVSSITIRLYAGPNGTMADTLIDTWTRSLTVDGTEYSFNEVVSWAASNGETNWGISVQPGTANTHTIDLAASVKKTRLL